MATKIVNNGTKHDKLVLQNLIARAAEHYTCNRGPRPSGALMVCNITSNGERIVMYGDVIPTNNSPSCKDVGCMIEDGHCVRNVHAEVHALLRSAKYGIPTDNGTMYSINKPCFNCTKACIAAGITKIVYAYAVYDEQRTKDIIADAGMECIHAIM